MAVLSCAGVPESEVDYMPVPGIFLETEPSWVVPRAAEWRRVSEKGLELTASMEGFRARLYDDPAGFCTIGFGHLVRRARCDGSEPAHFLRGLARPEARELLRDDMGIAERAVSALVTSELTSGQHAALCDFTYNVGSGNLQRSTLLRYVNAGLIDRVPGQFRRYVLANGRKLRGLVTRREKEIELFFDDLTIPRSAPDPDEDLSPIDIRQGL
jgi:GH24 family phage-related lysozyme (muramidase)